MMLDAEGGIIYVGKAKNLRARLKQYFYRSGNKTAKVMAMLEHVADFRYIICPSEVDALVHVDLAEISDGYKWAEIKESIKREIGWVESAEPEKGLHTSCSIERCKEYTQFTRFREMKSRVIPYTAIEMAIAVRDGNLSREEAMREIRTSTGFFGKPREYAEMIRPIEDK